MADNGEWRIRTVTRTASGLTHEVEVSGPDLDKVRAVYDELRPPEPSVVPVPAPRDPLARPRI